MSIAAIVSYIFTKSSFESLLFRNDITSISNSQIFFKPGMNTLTLNVRPRYTENN